MSEVVSVFEKDEAKVFTTYDVELTFTDKLLGGIPKDTKMISSWLKAHAGVESEEILRRRLIDTVRDLGHDPADLEGISDWDALEAAVESIAGETKTQGFKQNGSGLYIEDRGIKAMLKESASIVIPSTQFFSKDTGKPLATQDTKKGKGLRSLIAEWVYVTPREVLLDRDVPDEIEMRTIHSPRGSSLGYFEAVVRPILRFKVKVLHDLIQPKTWAELWIHAQSNGLGASRSQGYGIFKVTKWETASKASPPPPVSPLTRPS